MAGMGTLIILCSQEWRREEFRTVVRGKEDRNRSGETKQKKSREEKVGAGNKVRGEHSDKGGGRWKGMKTEKERGKKKKVLNRRFESKMKRNKGKGLGGEYAKNDEGRKTEGRRQSAAGVRAKERGSR